MCTFLFLLLRNGLLLLKLPRRVVLLCPYVLHPVQHGLGHEAPWRLLWLFVHRHALRKGCRRCYRSIHLASFSFLLLLHAKSLRLAQSPIIGPKFYARSYFLKSNRWESRKKPTNFANNQQFFEGQRGEEARRRRNFPEPEGQRESQGLFPAVLFPFRSQIPVFAFCAIVPSLFEFSRPFPHLKEKKIRHESSTLCAKGGENNYANRTFLLISVDVALFSFALRLRKRSKKENFEKSTKEEIKEEQK